MANRLKTPTAGGADSVGINARWIGPFYGLNHEADVVNAQSGGFGPLDGFPQSLVVGQTTETDSALQIAGGQTITTGQSGETDSVQVAGLAIGVGQSSEVDSGLITGLGLGTGVATEVDDSLSASLVLQANQASEVSSVQSTGVSLEAGITAESNAALLVGTSLSAGVPSEESSVDPASTTMFVGQPSESSLTLSVGLVLSAGAPSEASSALLAGLLLNINIVSETSSTALAGFALSTGQPSGSDSASQSGLVLAVGASFETSFALLPSISLAHGSVPWTLDEVLSTTVVAGAVVVPVGFVAEADSAPGSAGLALSVGLLSTVDEAFLASLVIGVGIAVESDLALSGGSIYQVAYALEFSEAPQATFVPGDIKIPSGVATETCEVSSARYRNYGRIPVSSLMPLGPARLLSVMPLEINLISGV